METSKTGEEALDVIDKEHVDLVVLDIMMPRMDGYEFKKPLEKTITIGEVVLDYNSMTVSRSDESIELPQKEFLLLYKLLSYPGQIFTRIQLMDEIWGHESDTGWETVTVHIGRLRKRFESWPEFGIESVRGLGYKAVKRYE